MLGDVEAVTLATTGLPRLPASPFQRAVPTTPADRPGACVDCFPAHTAFPGILAGRPPHFSFPGLLSLHPRYRPLARPPPPRHPPHHPSAPPVTPPTPPSPP